MEKNREPGSIRIIKGCAGVQMKRPSWMNSVWPAGYVGCAEQSKLDVSWGVLERLKEYV